MAYSSTADFEGRSDRWGLLLLADDLSIFELTLVDLACLCEGVLALAVELSVHEVALVDVAVLLLVARLSCLFAVGELAVVEALAGVPSFNAEAVLLFVFPLAVVDGLVDLVDEDALAFGLAVDPVTLVDVAICKDHLTLAVHVLVLDLAGVHRAVSELDVAEALPRVLVVGPELALVLALAVDLGPVVLPDDFLLALLVGSPLLVRQKFSSLLVDTEKRRLWQVWENT